MKTRGGISYDVNIELGNGRDILPAHSPHGTQVAGNANSWLVFFSESLSRAHQPASRGKKIFLNIEIWLWEGDLLTYPPGRLATPVDTAEALGEGLR